MAFPVSPANGATYTTGGKTYVYNSTKGAWAVSNAGSSTVPTLINTGGGQTISGTLVVTGNTNVGNLGTSTIVATSSVGFSVSAANFGGISLTGSGTGGKQYVLSSTDNTNGLGGGRFNVYDQTASASRITVDTNGNVGIGNNSPAHRISINGNLFTSSVSTNYQVSNATATTVNTTTPTTIASVTITTVGKPVLLIASGDMNPQTGNDWNVIAFYRDSTQVGKIIIAQGGGTSFNNPWALTHIDVPAAGTYTYTVKAYQGTGTTLYGETGAGQAPTLVAMELI